MSQIVYLAAFVVSVECKDSDLIAWNHHHLDYHLHPLSLHSHFPN